MKKRLVVLTGAGISAESGIRTFRDSGGLWENHSIEDVATPEAWRKNPALVLQFYNGRRQQAAEAQPNAAHLALVALETYFDVQIITQNVDDLHERAGSTQVCHLHGELRFVRSVTRAELRYDIGAAAISLGDTAEDGGQLRPDIVWFGEDVPLLSKAAEICKSADYFLLVGTSLQVYPAAGLIHDVPRNVPRFVVDPNLDKRAVSSRQTYLYAKNATEGVPEVAQKLIELIS